MADLKVKQPKGVKLDHISKIYNDPKTGKEFYAVHYVELDITPGSTTRARASATRCCWPPESWLV